MATAGTGTMDFSKWKPYADGAWAQIHILLEMEKDHAAGYLLKNFRIVSWILETGKVIVNDVLSQECEWYPCHTDVTNTTAIFKNMDGKMYGFSFRSTTQAKGCTNIISSIISSASQIRQLLSKFTKKPARKECLSILNGAVLCEIKGIRKSLNAVSINKNSNLESSEDHFDLERDSIDSIAVYPKEDELDMPEGIEAIEEDDEIPAVEDDLTEEESPNEDTHGRGATSRIVAVSMEELHSSQHLLTQFSEVEKTTLAATEPGATVSTSQSATEQEDNSTTSSHTSIKTSRSSSERVSMRILQKSSKENNNNEAEDNYSSPSRDRISLPFKTRQEVHVTYNYEQARYEGLPFAWRILNQQFGMPLEAVQKHRVLHYEAKIPAVLQMMKAKLFLLGGDEVKGIFRLAPDKDACLRVKQAINDGNFHANTSSHSPVDVHIMANLIKVWFRELPESLFNMVPEKHIYQVCQLKDPTQVMKSLDAYPPLHRSLVFWLLDLMVEIVKKEKINKMSARNMAIVMSPNLFSIASNNPMCALTMSQKVAEYTRTLLQTRLLQTS